MDDPRPGAVAPWGSVPGRRAQAAEPPEGRVGRTVVQPDARGTTRTASAALPRARSSTGKRSPFRVVGFILLAAALAAAGYLAWLFWGTGLVTAHEQSRLRAGIAPHLQDHPVNGPTSGRVDVPGSAIGILEIPRMHLDMVVVQGVDTASLEKGPGHYPGSALPWENRGRVAIAAHRTTYLHPFWSLNLLRPGDLIKIETEYGTFRYHVTRSATLSPADRSVLDQTANPTLVLTTCTPRFSASHRLVVFADRE